MQAFCNFVSSISTSMSLCVSFCPLSVCHCLCLCLSVSLPWSVCLLFCLYVSLSVFFCLSVWLCLCISLYLCVVLSSFSVDIHSLNHLALFVSPVLATRPVNALNEASPRPVRRVSQSVGRSWRRNEVWFDVSWHSLSHSNWWISRELLTRTTESLSFCDRFDDFPSLTATTDRWNWKCRRLLICPGLQNPQQERDC